MITDPIWIRGSTTLAPQDTLARTTAERATLAAERTALETEVSRLKDSLQESLGEVARLMENLQEAHGEVRLLKKATKEAALTSQQLSEATTKSRDLEKDVARLKVD